MHDQHMLLVVINMCIMSPRPNTPKLQFEAQTSISVVKNRTYTYTSFIHRRYDSPPALTYVCFPVVPHLERAVSTGSRHQVAVATVGARAGVGLQAARGTWLHHVPLRLGRVIHVPDTTRAGEGGGGGSATGAKICQINWDGVSTGLEPDKGLLAVRYRLRVASTKLKSRT